jgi:hypothetical protein
MRARTRAIASRPDEHFLFWVMKSLVAGTVVSGVMAVMMAMTAANIQ